MDIKHTLYVECFMEPFRTMRGVISNVSAHIRATVVSRSIHDRVICQSFLISYRCLTKEAILSFSSKRAKQMLVCVICYPVDAKE
jgi:hypothetical protein